MAYSTDIGIWGPEDLAPRVYRNTPDDDLTVVHLHGTLTTWQRVSLYAGTPDEAREMIAKLRAACDEWETLVASIAAEATAVA